MKQNKFSGPVLLVIAAFIWGSAFVAQSEGSEHVGPYTFVCLRSILGTAVLTPVVIISNFFRKKKGTYIKPTARDNKNLFFGGIICGVVFCFASAMQQTGLDKGAEPGKAGFITALYILLVPIFSLFSGKKIRPVIWGCVMMSLVALWLLCVKEDNSVSFADLYILICAFLFALHILVIDKFSPLVNGISLSAAQFFIAAIISAVPTLIFEDTSKQAIISAFPAIAYAGIMSSGVAFTFQIIAQKRTEPTLASMLMSLESVFAVLTSLVLLGQVPSLREALGCIIMFIAIIIAQLPQKKASGK